VILDEREDPPWFLFALPEVQSPCKVPRSGKGRDEAL
jgi:hypothetical protein